MWFSWKPQLETQSSQVRIKRSEQKSLSRLPLHDTRISSLLPLVHTQAHCMAAGAIWSSLTPFQLFLVIPCCGYYFSVSTPPPRGTIIPRTSPEESLCVWHRLQLTSGNWRFFCTTYSSHLMKVMLPSWGVGLRSSLCDIPDLCLPWLDLVAITLSPEGMHRSRVCRNFSCVLLLPCMIKWLCSVSQTDITLLYKSQQILSVLIFAHNGQF